MIHDTFNNLDPKKKIRILKAAKKEFILKGFDHAKVKSICNAADIPRSAFYRYFDSLEDCLESIFENMHKEKIDQLENLIIDKSGLQQLDSTIEILRSILDDEETFLFYISLIKSNMLSLPMLRNMQTKFALPLPKKKEVLRKILLRNITGLAEEHYFRGVSKEKCIEEYKMILKILKRGLLSIVIG